MAVALATLFSASSFRKGWTQVQSDFPNYYTAAVLARQHLPLERFYDWPWFQRQMNYAGTERQLGSYIPQTPLTMIPLLPLSGLPPQTAKRIWLTLNLVFLILSAVLLARLTRTSTAIPLLIAFAGYESLASNFLLGQYYVFLLFLITLALWGLATARSITGGFVMGVACMLKLYTAPFFFYFLWKRQWRALLGMLAACLVLGALSVAWFGWHANLFYVNYVLSRASENAILDPYHPGAGAFTNLLRRTFIAEPELNPHPLLQAPFVFFFLRPFLTMAVLAVPLLAIRREHTPSPREIAWFFVAILLASPNTASYVFILLVLPVVILMDGVSRRWALALVSLYILLCLFPTIWWLLALYFMAGYGSWRGIRLRPAIVVFTLIAAISLWSARSHQRSYNQEPPRMFASVSNQPSSIYASSPAISATGLVFESISAGRYVLNRTMAFEGQAFHPSVPASGHPIFFELAAHGHSRIMSFDPRTNLLEGLTAESLDATNPAVTLSGDRLAFISQGQLFVRGQGALVTPHPVQDAAWFPTGDHLAFSVNGAIYDSRDGLLLAPRIAGEQSEPAISPDGKWLALTATRQGIRHIWIEELSTKTAHELTGGNCNSDAAAWEPDSQAVIFPSDCTRGLGLPSLYRSSRPQHR
ncbi:MAG: glycosyltransferase 87 family protein [Bryobacteraceae bacterium]